MYCTRTPGVGGGGIGGCVCVGWDGMGWDGLCVCVGWDGMGWRSGDGEVGRKEGRRRGKK